MTVEVFKPVLRSRPGRSFARAKAAVNSTDTPLREIRHIYKPIQQRLDLVVGIEAMTHPDRPSFAELEAVVYSELS